MKDVFDGLSISTGGEGGLNNLKPSAYDNTTEITRPYTGQKYFGGINYDYTDELDYWQIRQRSADLFRRNSYARGLLRRLVTNAINTGLIPEAIPEEQVLGISKDEANDFSENVEARFKIYDKTPSLCDFLGEKTLAQLQTEVFTESLIDGDVLVMLVGADPKVKLVPGSAVNTPSNRMLDENIRHGVEYKNGKVVAYHVEKENGKHERVKAYGTKTGRLQAWLFFASDKRAKDARGEPLLSLIIQNLKEIDDYRDSAQRKANIGSKFVGAIERENENTLNSQAITKGAAVKNQGYQTTNNEGDTKQYNFSEISPGMIIETLSAGETLKAFNGATDVDFQKFENTIVSGMAWALEIPPEIAILSFNSNYSASQSAKEEFKMTLNMIRTLRVGEGFLTPIYKSWLLNQHATRQIETFGFMESFRSDPMKFNAWCLVDWSGAIKPSSDIVKTANGYAKMVDRGFITNTRATRETTGGKFSTNMKLLKRENEQLVEAMRPLAEFKKEFGFSANDPTLTEVAKNNGELLTMVDKEDEES